MNNFKMQCINYLLVRGWVQEYDGWEWALLSFEQYDLLAPVGRDTIGEAIDLQMELDDEEPNPVVE